MSFHLTILGTSSALPTSDRYPTAHVLNVHERLFLIDCGEGTQMQMRRYKIRFGRLGHIFISHLHGDHMFGLYGLLSTLNLMGRKEPISIFGPVDLERLLNQHFADFDIHLNFKINFTGISGNKPQVILETKRITVTAFPLMHRVPTYGYLFREKEADLKILKDKIQEYNISIKDIAAIKKGGDLAMPDGKIVSNSILTIPSPAPKSYAFCSDTKYFKKLSSFVSGVDLLYHEATFDKSKTELAHQVGHSTASEAATVALEAGVKKLLIGHFSARYRDASELEAEAREIFPATEAGKEGTSYEV
jgi:ribonuclease Z